MRQDAEPFRSRNAARVKYPRIVVKIEFEVESLYLTSHTGIDGVPGVVIENVLQDPNATSQKIVPDEARSEIGAFSFTIVDKDSVFTDAIRTRLLDDGYGLRGKFVRLYVGYAGLQVSGGEGTFGGGSYGEGTYGGSAYALTASFDDFALFQTQVITGVSYDAGLYRVQCNDITREQREDIFEPKTTTLRTALTDSATTVEVYDTSRFQPIAHGTSYSDSPSATVGYIKVEKEIIKYTGKTADSFTGCTRGALNTKAIAHTFDSAASQERRPKVEEYIYIEEPCAKVGYKILTGKDPLTQVDCWPSHWHLGIDPDLVRVEDFTGIGDDLWTTSDDTAGFVSAFYGLEKVTGKRFLESEIYVLLGCYSPIYANGQIGLKRMNHVLAQSASVMTLNETNCISWSELRHEYGMLHNRIRIDWNWNGTEFTRTTLFIDQSSIDIHGPAPVKTYQFKGLHGSRHTDALIRTRLDAIRDRYSQPPEGISVTAMPSLNVLEVGDIPKVELSTVRDFAAEGENINRSFEIQQASYNWGNGGVNFQLFGSTARASVESPTEDTSSLPDAFYTDRGTELSTVVTISVVGGVGIIQAGTYNLTGHADVNHDDAIYYYDGDLQLASGATITINDNVQLRVNGFYQHNGTIDGIGRGNAGSASSGTTRDGVAGTQGFVGNTRGMDGVEWFFGGLVTHRLHTVPTVLTEGQYSAFPYLEIAVDGNDLLGIPSDLRGTSGGSGGKLIFSNSLGYEVEHQGGTGGDSGAGLVVVCKGMAFGGAGSINLSGTDAAETTPQQLVFFPTVYPGSGAGGGPGSFLILLDGADISLPDVSGKFSAATGETPVLGNLLPDRTDNRPDFLTLPLGGYQDPSIISSVNLSDVCHRIQYIPATQTPAEDTETPAAPTNLTATASINKITLKATVNLIPGDRIEYYASDDNDRSNAVRVGFGAQTEFVRELATGSTEYYWVRVRRVQPGVDLFSDFYPSSATDGVSSTPNAVATTDIASGAVTASYSASDAGPDTYTTEGYALSIGSIGPFSVAATIDCYAEADIAVTGAAAGWAEIWVYDGTTFYKSTRVKITASYPDYSRYPISFSQSVAASTTCSAFLRVHPDEPDDIVTREADLNVVVRKR